MSGPLRASALQEGDLRMSEHGATASSGRWIWPGTAVVCALVISTGLYFGLKDSAPLGDNAPPASAPVPQDLPYSAPPPPSNANSSATQAPHEDPNEIVVYVTRTGECYHRGSCSSLRRSKIPMSLKDAKQRYRPCSRCSPPR